MDLTRIFSYHRPFGTQPTRYSQIREKAKELAQLVQDSTPTSREQSLALTAVQQAVMWANAAIAINEIEDGEQSSTPLVGTKGVYTTAILAVARICHEVNRAYCHSIGDDSQPTWEDAPLWQRASAANGVEYHVEHRDSTPADSHKSWLAEKERDGWKYGPVKNPDLKEHPCFVPYEELPAAQQAKDYIFLAVVRNVWPLVYRSGA